MRCVVHYTSFSECPMDLQAPKHGSIQYSKDKPQASIRCQDGYNRLGSATVKCQNGKWTIFKTICIVNGKKTQQDFYAFKWFYRQCSLFLKYPSIIYIHSSIMVKIENRPNT